MTETKRAGIWIRVSTDEQAQGQSPGNHRKRAEMYCELHGWQPVEIYDLSGVSGKTVIEHPVAQRMFNDIQSGHINGLIFSRLARLARNTRELLEIADLFKQHNAALISIAENLDTSTPAGQLMYTLISALAEWERAEISARVAASIPIRAAQGKPTGGAGPWGYKWEDTGQGKQLIIDKSTSETIQLIFKICLEEKGNVAATARRLNAMGIRSRKGASFTNTNLGRILDDTVYIGKKRANYAQSTGDGKHWVYKPESEWIYYDVEPIIDQNTWDKIQGMRAHRGSYMPKKVPPKESKYLFGGVLYCQCGNKMYVYHRKKNGDPTYICRKCKRKIGEEKLSSGLKQALERVIIAPDDIKPVLDTSETPDELRTRGCQLMREAEKIKRKQVNLIDLYVADPRIKEAVLPQLHDLVEQQKSLEKEAMELELQADQLMLTDAGHGALLKKAAKLSKLWDDLEYEEQRQVIKELIERIDCRDDEMHYTVYWLPSLCKGSHTVKDSWPRPA